MLKLIYVGPLPKPNEPFQIDFARFLWGIARKLVLVVHFTTSGYFFVNGSQYTSIASFSYPNKMFRLFPELNLLSLFKNSSGLIALIRLF